MTAAEKANELVNRFLEQVEHYQAKEFAGIVVDEILSELNQLRKPEYTTFIIEYSDPEVPGDPGETMDGYGKKEYWQQVKNEIEAL
jgi:hypothetical protein